MNKSTVLFSLLVSLNRSAFSLLREYTYQHAHAVEIRSSIIPFVVDPAREAASNSVEKGKSDTNIDEDIDQENDFFSDSMILQSLKDRQRELNEGVGKRFIARTQRGFLNVHEEPTDPFDTNNIINTLSEGQIVTSVGPSQGPWIHHDAGGWSISKFGNFTWLEPLQE